MRLRTGTSIAFALTLGACPAGDDTDRADTGPTLPPIGTSGMTGTSDAMTTTGASTTASTTPDTGSTSPDDGPSFDVGMSDSTGEPCVPVSEQEMVCDDIDDDCNGIVDDIDEGGDGICDCLAIAIVGVPGSLAASEFQQWLIDRGTTTDRIDPPLVDAAVLDPYDVIVLDQLTRSYDPAEAAAFDTWVTEGGGLMSMTGHTASPVSAQQWPNSILGPMGLEYQGVLLSGPVTDFLPHPTTVGLTSVTFLGGFAVVETIPGLSEVVAQLPGPVAAAQVQQRGNGRLFIWGDEWIEYDSEWTMLPEITQLWTNIFAWLAPADICAPPEG